MSLKNKTSKGIVLRGYQNDDFSSLDIVKNEKWKDAYGAKALAFETDYTLEIDEQYQFDLASSSMRATDSLLLEYLNNDSY